MSNLNGREVVAAKFHQGTIMPTYGNIGTSLDRLNAKTGTGGIKMVKVEDGLELIGKGWSGFIPNGNIISLTFATEKA